jgi:hypothetical protein
VKNKNYFLPEDTVKPNVTNLKYFDMLQDLVDTKYISQTLRWIHYMSDDHKKVS